MLNIVNVTCVIHIAEAEISEYNIVNVTFTLHMAEAVIWAYNIIGNSVVCIFW